jgi:hypothetical protein
MYVWHCQHYAGGRTRAGKRDQQRLPTGLASVPSSTNNLIYWVNGNDFDWRTFDFDHDMDTIDEALAARSNANAADLEEFKSHGGTLIPSVEQRDCTRYRTDLQNFPDTTWTIRIHGINPAASERACPRG